MATGRVLVVHEYATTRSLMTELVGREGLRASAVDSTFECMTSYVEEPADLVILGLGGIDKLELQLIAALKKEEPPPRIVLTFPGPKRELAVEGLTLGADAYVLEPFYGEELVSVVRGILGEAMTEDAPPLDALAQLSSEVAHAVNNPLQVLSLLLAKDKVTKRELMKGIPEQTARIEAVIRQLREFSSIAPSHAAAQDVRAAAAASELPVAPGRALQGRIDAANYTAALDALHAALRARSDARFEATLAEERDAVALRCAVPRGVFRDEQPDALLDEIFVVGADREIRPGLALPRRLLEGMGGSLAADQHGEEVRLVARVGRA